MPSTTLGGLISIRHPQIITVLSFPWFLFPLLYCIVIILQLSFLFALWLPYPLFAPFQTIILHFAIFFLFNKVPHSAMKGSNRSLLVIHYSLLLSHCKSVIFDLFESCCTSIGILQFLFVYSYHSYIQLEVIVFLCHNSHKITTTLRFSPIQF